MNYKNSEYLSESLNKNFKILDEHQDISKAIKLKSNSKFKKKLNINNSKEE